MRKVFIILAVALMSVFDTGIATSQLPAVSAQDEKDNIEGTNFTIVPRANYHRSYWVIRIADGEIIGYAPWDIERRRWTLFNLYGQVQGFFAGDTG